MLTPEEEAEYRRIKDKSSDQLSRAIIKGDREAKQIPWAALLCCGGAGVIMAFFSINSYLTGFSGSNYRGNFNQLIFDLIVWAAIPIIVGIIFFVYLKQNYEKYGHNR
jgi:hypothetical protein